MLSTSPNKPGNVAPKLVQNKDKPIHPFALTLQTLPALRKKAPRNLFEGSGSSPLCPSAGKSYKGGLAPSLASREGPPRLTTLVLGVHSPLNRPRRVLLSAGEVSGDNYAGQLVRELRNLDPSIEVAGFAGPKAEAAGAVLQENLLRYSVMGIVQVLRRARSFFKLIQRIKKHLDDFQPDVVVPIDFPGLNFLLCKWAKQRGIPVAFYVSPQLWAWAGWRIYKVRRRVDRMLVILPFEEDYYAERGVRVTFVGHPLFDYLRTLPLDKELVPRLREGRTGPLVAILPGSRAQEISLNLPIFLRAAAILAERHPGTTFAVPNPGQDPTIVELLETGLRDHPIPGLKLHLGSPYEIMSEADVALVTSGTATIELTFFETPMVVGYQESRIAVALGKRLTKTDHIALVNILGRGEIVPEYFESHDCSEEIARDATALLSPGTLRDETIRALRRVRESMGEAGASRRAAKTILELIPTPQLPD